LLGLQTYFTAGVKEVRAWTIHVGDTAPQAAGVIHTDFERGFIRAQTIALADFLAYKGEQGAKEAGKMRAEGKEYVVKDGDVLNFLFNVTIDQPLRLPAGSPGESGSPCSVHRKRARAKSPAHRDGAHIS
jgi:hypothetical protein